MKYKYTGTGSVLVSSKSSTVTLKNGEIVEFDEKDVKMQNLTEFVKVEEVKMKKTIKENDK